MDSDILGIPTYSMSPMYGSLGRYPDKDIVRFNCLLAYHDMASNAEPRLPRTVARPAPMRPMSNT